MHHKSKALASILAASAMALSVGAAGASAKTTVYHFFSKGVYFHFSDSQGHPLPQNHKPQPGDRISAGSNDFVGNHQHHARRATASDHISCTIIDEQGNGLCDGSIAIGGSMIFADDFVIPFGAEGPTTQRIPITGGTGQFRRATGTVNVQSAGENSDLQVVVH